MSLDALLVKEENHHPSGNSGVTVPTTVTSLT